MKIIPRIRKRLLRLSNQKRMMQHQGVWFLLDPKNWIDNRIIAGYGYEENLIQQMFATIERLDIDTFLDIGANIGYYTLRVAGHPKLSEIHSFEPVLRNLYQLHAGLYINGYEHRVTTHHCALSDSKEERIIHIDPRSTGISRLSLEHAQRDVSVFTQQETIHTDVLDTLLPMKNRRIFIKIDTEGHEVSVLKGMPEFLRENQCFMQVEVAPENKSTVDALLKEAGYRYLSSIADNAFYCNFPQD